MFARYRLLKTVTHILHEEFGFELDAQHYPALKAVCCDAVAQSFNAYDAAVIFMIEVLRKMHGTGLTKDEIVPVSSHLANARISTIARLIDERRVTPWIVDAWLGHALREVRQAYA